MPPQASSQPLNPLPHERPVLRRVGLLLHFGLVAILAVLLVVAANGHMEHVVETPLNEFERVSNTISISLLVFITSYNVLLVLVTQQIALHRAVTSYQTLTAIHDITSSWSGLGAAILSCWRQLAIPASVRGTGAVTVYLACIAIIHILFPTTIKLQLAGQTASAAATLAHPNFTLVGDDSQYNWMTPNTLLPLLADLNPSQTPGLYNSTLYTVLDHWDGIGDVSVPAVSFNVSCGYLPNARTGGVVNGFLPQTGDDPSPPPVSYTVVEATYASQDTQYNFSYYSHPLDYRQINSVLIAQGHGLGDNSTSQPLGRGTLFYSSFTVTDSLGSQGSLLALPNTIASNSAERPRDLQVFGCSMSVYNHTVDIDAATRLPKVDVARKTSSKWEPWAPRLSDEHDVEPDGSPLAVQDIFIDGWTLTYYHAQYAPTLNPAGWSCWNYPSETGTVSYCGQIDITNLVTQYIEDRLELRERNLTDIALHELENTMGSMTAALYWGAQHGRYRQLDPQTMFVQGIRGAVDVTRIGAIGRLNINLISVVPCLAIALILLLLSYLMTFRQSGLKHPMDRTNLGTPAPKRSPIDTIGILQSFWLSQGSIRSELLQRVSNVDDPTVENLRRAGMFMVQLDGQPRNSGGGSEISLLSMPDHKYQN